MNQKSIRALHNRIGFTLKWSWVVLISANLLFLLLFMLMNFLSLKNSSTVWMEFFLDRLQQVEHNSGGDGASSIPVIHHLTIDILGTILDAPTPTLVGMSLNDSGFFGKIHQLQPGEVTIFFFPDLVDGAQHVHFVKRHAGEFIVDSFEPRDFFPISLAGQTSLSVVTGGIIWYSDDPRQIGNIHRNFPIRINSGRIYTSFTEPIPEMPGASLVITQDITIEIRTLLLVALILILIFGGVSLRTINIQQDLTTLKDEQAGLMQLIQTLSAVILQPGEDARARLENLAPALHRAFHDAGNMELKFEENLQYQSLVAKFIEDILLLVDTVKKDGAMLFESEEKFRTAFMISPDSININRLDDGMYISINQGFSHMMGYTETDVIGKRSLDLQIWENPADRYELVKRLRKDGFVSNLEARFLRKDGGIKYGLMSAAVINLGGIPHIFNITHDITERKQAEAKIRAALEEKETLLREVHHRVKNNLHIIIALIKMRARLPQDAGMLQFLKELENQAYTMSLVYEQLYQSENLASVNMEQYLQLLTFNVLDTYGRRDSIQLQLDAPLTLDVAQATPCGLIVNELLSNILKYAFPPGFKGEPAMGVSLRREGETYHLTVSDNGVGFPPGYDWRTGQSMGLRLVSLWATHQLGGTLTVSGETGTTFEITFDLKD